MAELTDKVENALNETRMLILGSQVLLAFQYQGVFQPGFDRLATDVQHLKLLALLLMLVAVGLLLAPGAYHQIAEKGEDTRRVVAFTNRIAALALLPFALAIGINLFVASDGVLGRTPALVVGILGGGLAISMWYGVEWLVRIYTRSISGVSQAMRESVAAAQEEMAMANGTPLSAKIKQVLTEARVVLPGVQALLGFQFIAMLTDAFEKLPKQLQYVHVASLGCIALSMILLLAPAAFHRIVERGEDTQRIQSFSSAMVLAALVPLALGLSGDLLVVAEKVSGSTAFAVSVAAVVLVFCLGLWFGLTLALRWWRPSTDPSAGLHNRSTGARAELVSRQ
ncbi:MAG: hypothetical protein JOZ81_28435 [Chloroflexi bacterium]|nr:hypothetical protein [Chloroflexota bacterium]